MLITGTRTVSIGHWIMIRQWESVQLIKTIAKARKPYAKLFWSYSTDLQVEGYRFRGRHGRSGNTSAYGYSQGHPEGSESNSVLS